MGNPYTSHGALELLCPHKRRNEFRVDEKEKDHPDCDFETPTRFSDFCVNDFHEPRLTERISFVKVQGKFYMLIVTVKPPVQAIHELLVNRVEFADIAVIRVFNNERSRRSGIEIRDDFYLRAFLISHSEGERVGKIVTVHYQKMIKIFEVVSGEFPRRMLKKNAI